MHLTAARIHIRRRREGEIAGEKAVARAGVPQHVCRHRIGETWRALTRGGEMPEAA